MQLFSRALNGFLIDSLNSFNELSTAFLDIFSMHLFISSYKLDIQCLFK